ncbi:hypothetical protein N307_10040, partial [Dryobates pubescens]
MARSERLFNLLEAHGARPSVQVLDWARENWHNFQSVADRIVALQKDARAKAGKGKGFICAVLGACLAASVKEKEEWHERDNTTISSLQDLVSSLQSHVATLKDVVADLKIRLEKERRQNSYLDSKQGVNYLESAPVYPRAELATAKEAAVHVRPLIKTEVLYEDGETTPTVTTKDAPFSYTVLAKIRKEFARSAVESEVEYVWRVSQTGGDQIMLTEAEAMGYWGDNVFLTTKNRSGPWSLTQRAAYWAGGFDPKERGEPVVLQGGMNQIMENVQKAACLQMIYERELKHHFESPLSLLVDANRMTPLIRGLPDSLKIRGIELQKEIANTPLSSRTWEDLGRELLDYARQYDIPEESKKPQTRGLRHVKMIHPPSPQGQSRRIPSRHLARGREHLNTRQYWWGVGQKKGIPKEVVDGVPTRQLEIIVKCWPEPK